MEFVFFNYFVYLKLLGDYINKVIGNNYVNLC